MSEQSGEAQGAAQAQGAEQSTTAGQQGQGQGQQQGQEETFDKDRALATIRAQRDSEKALKEQLAQSQAKLKEFEDQHLSDSEKTTKRLAEIEAENASLKLAVQNRELADAFDAAGRKAGARVPRDVWKLVPLSAVQFNDDGTVKNADRLVDALKQSSPEHFLSAGTANGGARATAGQRDINDSLRDWMQSR